jgi:hypothetical protein
MKKHGSRSDVQIKIEKEIVEKITRVEKIQYKTGGIPVGEKKVKFNFDFHFFSEEKNIIGEIYARIDNGKGAVESKVAKDCLKLLYAEKILGKSCCKRIIFIDENVKSVFERETKWIANVIKEFGIQIELMDVSEENMKELILEREEQKISNQKKVI